MLTYQRVSFSQGSRMRLLVSVRSADEPVLAANHGPDIVIPKEPDAASLGRVSQSVLGASELQVPPHVPLGVALGDATEPDELADVIDRLAPPAHAGGIFLKIGFAGVSQPEQVSGILRRAVARAGELGSSVAVIAASYADCGRAGALSPDGILDAAIGAGASGVLIDTWIKDGRGLLEHLSVDTLAEWVLRARRAGLLTALAGSIAADDLNILW